MAKAKTAKAKKTLACDVCGKKFAMPAHLGRHKTAMHGAKAKTAGKKTKKRLRGKKLGARKPGRPPAIATRFGLADLSMDELAALIKAARQEAARRMREFKAMLSS
jgi:hypothetical protein